MATLLFGTTIDRYELVLFDLIAFAHQTDS